MPVAIEIAVSTLCLVACVWLAVSIQVMLFKLKEHKRELAEYDRANKEEEDLLGISSDGSYWDV